MKTVLIYDQCGESDLKFSVVDGDWSKFNNVYVNSVFDISTELCDILFPDGSEGISIELRDEFPVDAVRNGANVVVIGFLP